MSTFAQTQKLSKIQPDIVPLSNRKRNRQIKKRRIIINRLRCFKDLRIVWDSDDYRSSDFEFWYNIELEHNKNIEINYKGYVYGVPLVTCCVSGSALITENGIINKSVNVLPHRWFNDTLPSVEDILAVLTNSDSEIKKKYPGFKVEIEEHSRHYFSYS